MNIYFDTSLIQDEYLSFLAPLLGVPSFSIWGEDAEQIKGRYEKSKELNLLSLSDKENCDYFVYPKYFRLDHFNELRKYSLEALHCHKKVLVFSYGEIDDYIDVNSNIIWFKRSTNVTNSHANEYCLPPFPQDLLQFYDNKITYIEENPSHKYSIGFTGYSTYKSIGTWLYYITVRTIGVVLRRTYLKKLIMLLKKESLYSRFVNAGIGNYCRGQAITYIKKLSQYTFNFTQRSHALTLDTTKDLRTEYIHNLNNSDFALSVRGFGNYSFRHYEVLSLGKIPLYIDTWAKLPFQSEIPYTKLFIIVPFKDIANIGHYIDAYIARNKGNLSHIQDEIRTVYENYFVMKNYYTKIISMLEGKVTTF